jgi:hypothetical protein
MESEAVIRDEIVSGFVQLFRGRGDARGSWDGGCIREKVFPETFRQHLTNGPFIGVYPSVPTPHGDKCVWGCSDIDVDDLDAARNLQTAFSIKSITSWVEKTRKGYHVWVFCNELVDASTMRRAFLAAHQAINYPAKEVNPKQESVGSGYGNYVRLPYYGWANGMPENRYILDEKNNPMDLEVFVDFAITTIATPDKLQSIAELWKPPAKPSFVNDIDTPQSVAELLNRATPIAYVMWRDGPINNQDRSSALWRMTCFLRDSGMEASAALKIALSADQRWGKFYLRPDGEEMIIKLVERCYNVVFGEHGIE